MTFIVYKDTADLYKLSEDSVQSDIQNYGRIVQGFKINIQPAGLEYAVTQPDGAIGKTYRGFTSQSGIRNGMLVVVSGTTTVSGMRYEVTGVEDFNGPLGRHYELLMRVQIN